MASSLAGQPLPAQVVCFGEVGLAGELRAVGRTQARLAEASRQGFNRALTAPGKTRAPAGLELLTAGRLDDALALLW